MDPRESGRSRPDDQLRCETAWKHAGWWLAALVAGVFLFFALFLALGPNRDLISMWLGWLGFLALIEIPLYLFTGPLYRPEVRSIGVRRENLVLRMRDDEEALIAYREVNRITCSSASSALVMKSGEKRILGFGFGGDQGDVILETFRAWAEENGVELLEYQTRDFFPGSAVKNLEVYERSAHLRSLSSTLASRR